MRRLPLLPSVGLAILAGVGLAVLSVWVLRAIIHTSTKPADPIDVTKVSLTIAGGVGGIVALVIAYRRQRDVEQGRFVERFGAAATQLGDNKVAVRIAGVYAMAAIADETSGIQRQQCIDVLCGYLRMPHDSALGANHQTKRIRKFKNRDSTGRDGEIEDHFEYLQNDKEVRQTICRVIGDHLRDDLTNWRSNRFDFRSAHLEEVDFSQAEFDDIVLFNEATFSGTCRFNDAKFNMGAMFTDAKFQDGAIFTKVTALAATFTHTEFCGPAYFQGMRTLVVTFDRSQFYSKVLFDGAVFGGRSPGDFGMASFDGVEFDVASFRNVVFNVSSSFAGACFSEHVTFANSSMPASNFAEARFLAKTDFRSCMFPEGVNFTRAKFENEASFDGVQFLGLVSFQGADFGDQLVSFLEPRSWGPPPPEFDWDDDEVPQPVNVKPDAWPPKPPEIGSYREWLALPPLDAFQERDEAGSASWWSFWRSKTHT